MSWFRPTPLSVNNILYFKWVQIYVFLNIKKRPIPNFGSGLITNSENSKNSENSENSEFYWSCIECKFLQLATEI